jgi:hypothetical protein
MGRYWACRRAGHGVPPGLPNPVSAVHFTTLVDGAYIGIGWSHSRLTPATITVNCWHVTAGVRDYLFDSSEASPGDDLKTLSTLPSSGEDYQAGIAVAGYPELFGSVETAA